MPIDNDALVYSTEHGDLRKQQPSATPGLAILPSQQIAFIHRASKGRGGKVVTLVQNLHLSPGDHKALTKHLKQTCGSGGHSKMAWSKSRGIHRRRAMRRRSNDLGYKTKLAGG